MIIQKAFHLHMAKEIAKSKLFDLAAYRHYLIDVKNAALSEEDRMAHFDFRLSCGFRAIVQLMRVTGENPSQTLFRSQTGNVEVQGVLEFFQIQPHLTEVVLTLDYRIGPPLFRLMDFLSNGMERFLNRQLEQIEAYFLSAAPLGPRADRNLAHPINGHQKG